MVWPMRRNLTVQLDEDTIRQARILAARRATSVSRLVAEELERLVNEDYDYERARTAAAAHLADGFHLGGGPLPERELLHER